MPDIQQGPGAWTLVAPEAPSPAPSTTVPAGSADDPLPAPVRTAAIKVRGISRGISVNGVPYPDVGVYVPNGFAQDRQITFSAALNGVSRTRLCQGTFSNCSDGDLFFELTPFKGENASLGLNFSVQSLSNRNNGTGIGQGTSMGFRTAVNITPTTGVAFGGENIIQFDSTTDLGKNYYFVVSQAIPLSSGDNPVVATLTAGVGSAFFGPGGCQTPLAGAPNTSSCPWGPIGSANVNFGSRVGVGVEWFGYGIGANVSLRPFSGYPLTLTFGATDFLGNVPAGIQQTCTTNPCETRYYGRATLSF